jgi:hypothetical protein
MDYFGLGLAKVASGKENDWCAITFLRIWGYGNL